MSNQSDALRRTLIVTVVTSVIVGGVAGGVIGAGVAGSGGFGQWLEDVFSTAPPSVGTTASESVPLAVEEESATTDVVAAASPAVGSIIINKDLSKYYNLTGPDVFSFPDFFEFGSPSSGTGADGLQQVGAGTGFLVSPDGYVLTNKHVVSGAEDEAYTFITSDGTSYDAKVIGTDPFNDLAVVKIEGTDLPYLTLGDSDSLKNGQTVIAIGNTLSEYSNTVTKGVISGIGRRIEAGDGNGQSETIENALQTDAAINRGNSGGPLLNLAGQVVGINTAVDFEGQLIGFAIPANVADPVIDSARAEGRIIRPYLGIRYRIVTKEFAEQNDLAAEYGALIVKGTEDDPGVIAGSPAEKAGLAELDIVLEVGGQRIDEEHSLTSALQQYRVNDTVELKVLSGTEERIVSVTLEEYTSQ